MGSGLSRRAVRKVAVDTDPDVHHPVSSTKIAPHYEHNRSILQSSPIAQSSPPARVDHVDISQTLCYQRPLSADTQLPSFQGGDYIEENFEENTNTLRGSFAQLPEQSLTPSPVTRPAAGGSYAAETIGVDGVDESQREMFEHTAMSLGMDWDEFLFNVLYFGNGEVPNMSAAINNAREETVALHSENNTPYKLRPASNAAIDNLKSETLLNLEDLDDPECAVCKESIDLGAQVIFLPSCVHCFHKECLVRWIKLQGFCPVCRAIIGACCIAESCNQGQVRQMSTISNSDRRLRRVRENYEERIEEDDDSRTSYVEQDMRADCDNEVDKECDGYSYSSGGSQCFDDGDNCDSDPGDDSHPSADIENLCRSYSDAKPSGGVSIGTANASDSWAESGKNSESPSVRLGQL